MVKRIWSGVDPGLHGCIVSLGATNDQPIFWHDWKSARITKDDHTGHARRLADLENQLNQTMLISGLFGTRESRHFASNQCHQYHLIYSAYYHGKAIMPLIEATACLQATLSRFGQVFKENDTSVRKKFIGDGANKPLSKLASALTARELLTKQNHVAEVDSINSNMNIKQPSQAQAIALDFLDAYVAALVCKYQWLTGEYYDLMRRKDCLAVALGVKRALTWRDIESYQKENVK